MGELYQFPVMRNRLERADAKKRLRELRQERDLLIEPIDREMQDIMRTLGYVAMEAGLDE